MYFKGSNAVKLYLPSVSLIVALVLFSSSSLAFWQGPKPIDHVVHDSTGIFQDRPVYKIPLEVCKNYTKDAECKKAMCSRTKGVTCPQKCEQKYPWASDGAWNAQVMKDCPAILKNQASKN